MTMRPIIVRDANGEECVAYQDVPEGPNIWLTLYRLFTIAMWIGIAWITFWVVWTILVLTDSPIIDYLTS